MILRESLKKKSLPSTLSETPKHKFENLLSPELSFGAENECSNARSLREDKNAVLSIVFSSFRGSDFLKLMLRE